MEDVGLALGAPPVGGLPNALPEGTLLSMVLRRMHRPRSCSYQLLLEPQRPSRIQGLRWVSVLERQASAWLRGLKWSQTSPVGSGLTGGPAGVVAMCVGDSHSWAMQGCAHVVPQWGTWAWRGEEDRALSRICLPLFAMSEAVVCSPGGGARHVQNAVGCGWWSGRVGEWGWVTELNNCFPCVTVATFFSEPLN